MAPNSEDVADLANGDSATYIRNMDRRLIVLETRFDTILPMLATKADLAELRADLKADLAELRADLKADLAELKAEFKADIGALRTEVYAFKADIHKWMTATLLTIFLGFAGMIVTMFTLLRPG